MPLGMSGDMLMETIRVLAGDFAGLKTAGFAAQKMI